MAAMAPGLNAVLAPAQRWRRPLSKVVVALSWGALVLVQPLQAGELPPQGEAPSASGAIAPSAAPAAASPAPTRQTIPTGLVSIESDIQRADQSTGVITATGNVRILYPDKGVMATARQAQYFSREGRVVLSGDVDVVQQDGSLLRAEQVTYLVRSERITARPAAQQQVFSRMRLTPASKPASAPSASTSAASGAGTGTASGAAAVSPGAPSSLVRPATPAVAP